MDTPAPIASAAALSRGKAWVVGGSLAMMAVASLVAALLLRGPDSSPQAGSAPAEPHETIVSTLSPTPKAPTKPVCTHCGVAQAVTTIERRERPSGPGAVAGALARPEEPRARARSMAEAKRL
ncbi:MAG: hypothetical protein ING89_14820 [Rubrivivax sp.]|jgi:hypothetical protein|nr:hypothetical protein [Rubrivivax sp.]